MCAQEEQLQEESSTDVTNSGLDLSINRPAQISDKKRPLEEVVHDNPRLKRQRDKNDALYLQHFISNHPLSKQDLVAVFGNCGILFDSPLMLLDLNDVDIPRNMKSSSPFGCSFRSAIGTGIEIEKNCPKSLTQRILKCKFKNKLELAMKEAKLKRGIEKLVLHRRDEISTIWEKISACKSFAEKDNNYNQLLQREFEWWVDPVLRKFAFFRRLLLPIQRLIHHPPPVASEVDARNSVSSNEEAFKCTKFEITSLDFSLMHLLLQFECLQILLLRALFQRIGEMEIIGEENPSCKKLLSSLLRLILDHIISVDTKKKDVAKTLKVCLSKVKDRDGTIQSALYITLQPSTPPSVMDFPVEKKGNGIRRDTQINSTKNDNYDNDDNNIMNDLKHSAIFSAETKWLDSLPSSLKKEEQQILEKAKSSLQEITQSQQIQSELICRRSRRPPKLKNRAFDGSLIYDSHQISRDQFIKRTKFMNRVNEKFQRRFTPGYSRPTIKRFQFSEETLTEIRSLFFDEDGSFRDSISPDIDISMNNDPRLISFGKVTTSSIRNDKRWQVTIRKHGLESKIATRTKLEAIYRREGVLTSDDDFHELAILVGGTEDQRLHHDVARQMAIWYKEKPSVNSIEKEPPLTGWEVDRIPYNQAMESPYSPSSMLVAMHDSGKFLLGIQKDQIILKCGDPSQCRVVGGCGAYLKIVRSNDNLVVVVVPVGCIFSGDFPHCGVRNFRAKSFEENLMHTCIENIESILREIPTRERLSRSQKIIQMMCKMPGLNKLCRLHSSSEMIDGPFRQPRNAVGFSYCQVNERDARCKAGETIPNEKIAFAPLGDR